MAKFTAKNGTPFSNKDAARIGPEIIRQMKLHGGGVNKRELVEAARSPRNPLHCYFEWDNDKAAERFRLQQAGKLLVSFEVVYTQGRQEHRVNLTEYVVQTVAPAVAEVDTGPQVRPQRGGRERLRSSQRRCYVPVTDVLSSPEYQDQLVQRAKDELQSYRNRYERIRQYIDFRTKFGRAFAEICRLIPVTSDDS